MHPEERERIEDVKQWVWACLEEDEACEEVLRDLAQGTSIRGTSSSPGSYKVLNLQNSPLKWSLAVLGQGGLYWVIESKHQDVIYSVIKQWNRERAKP